MSVPVLTLISLAAGVAALSGCVVVPTDPGYGYGPPAYRGPSAAVVVVPPPRHHYWDRGYYGGYGWRR